jgi:hypothetical protein
MDQALTAVGVELGGAWIDAELADLLPTSANSLKEKEQFRSREGLPYSVLKQRVQDGEGQWRGHALVETVPSTQGRAFG